MKTNIALAVSRQPEWITAMKKAEKQLNWNPKYWITYDANHSDVCKEFEDVVAHPRLDINRGIAAAGYENMFFGALTEHELELFSQYETTAMESLDRIDLGQSLSHPARLRFIYKLVVYWRNIINDLNIEIAIFSAPPHSIGYYLLYATMKILDRKVKIFKSTSLDNLHFISDSTDDIPDRLITKYTEYLQFTDFSFLEQDTVNSINKIYQAQPSYKPWYVNNVLSRDAKYKSIVQKIEATYKRNQFIRDYYSPDEQFEIVHEPRYTFGLLGKIRKRLRKKKYKNSEKELSRSFKVPGRPLDGTRIKLREYHNYRDWAMMKKIRIRERYKELCEPVPEGKKYVYFAMHYQPERTTCPEGGRFSSHYLCVALLSSALPDGWEIVIKEHPSQFSYTGMGELARWPEYYDDFIRLGNVRFTGLDTPSISLIDSAVAVATITGAAGWEALVRRKPVMYFGAAWYGGCVGAFRIRNIDNVVYAYDDIQKGTKPTEHSILAYAAALESIGHKMYTTPTSAKVVNIKDDMAEMFFNLLQKSG